MSTYLQQRDKGVAKDCKEQLIRKYRKKGQILICVAVYISSKFFSAPFWGISPLQEFDNAN